MAASAAASRSLELAGDDIFHGMRGNEYDIRKARERRGKILRIRRKKEAANERPATAKATC